MPQYGSVVRASSTAGVARWEGLRERLRLVEWVEISREKVLAPRVAWAAPAMCWVGGGPVLRQGGAHWMLL